MVFRFVFIFFLLRFVIDYDLECPKVYPKRNFDVEKAMGKWFIVYYYSNYEDIDSLNCMQIDLFSFGTQQITMNLTYSYKNDPIHLKLFGNITWTIPDSNLESHWIHTEENYDESYNTYVISVDYNSWMLLLHCAEKQNRPRDLFSFVMSRDRNIDSEILAYLLDNLNTYNIDTDSFYRIDQTKFCDNFTNTQNKYVLDQI